MTREEILAAAKQCVCGDRDQDYGSPEKSFNMIAALQQEIEKLRGQMPHWIPVEERLPEVWRNDETAELVNYMIYSPDFGVDIGNYHAKAKKWLCMALPCTVTYWAPLPEPPEVEDT